MKNYSFTDLTGGGFGALDKIDGALLTDLDMAFGIVNGVQHAYWLDEDSAAAENSPYVIAPDNNAGDKRWILSGFQPPFSHVIAKSNAGQSILDSTFTTAIFEDESYDTLNEYVHTTGIFTALNSGYYNVNTGVLFDSASWPTSGSVILEIVVNGTAVIECARNLVSAPITINLPAAGGATVYCPSGQTISINVRQSSGGTLDIISSADKYNYLTIDRIA